MSCTEGKTTCKSTSCVISQAAEQQWSVLCLSRELTGSRRFTKTDVKHCGVATPTSRHPVKPVHMSYTSALTVWRCSRLTNGWPALWSRYLFVLPVCVTFRQTITLSMSFWDGKRRHKVEWVAFNTLTETELKYTSTVCIDLYNFTLWWI